MANTRSAKKAHRVSERRQVFNARRSKHMKDAIKKTQKLIDARDVGSAQANLAALQKAVDKAAKGGTIKKNTASRIKSRISKRLATLSK
ncbi:MAG TPA: 30S ribosomal protein S20 [Candidatus Paceibacterota bacterium]|nr:30S ribosomal protein S20 [Candidatus Paceibacterota bacterium]